MVHVTWRTLALSICVIATSLAACGGGYHKMSTYRAGGSAMAPAHDRDRANTESYARIVENDFRNSKEHPLSTFAIDVDTASYSNVRSFLNAGTRPPKDAVRLEELINYFGYDYPEPKGVHPFSIVTEVGPAPWNPKHLLLHIGLKGRSISNDKMPARNLVFLLDVSGSMSSRNKLPLLIAGLSMLVNNLNERDRVAIVVYAGAAGVVLPPTSGDNKPAILDALRKLRAGGSTNGGQGIQLAYALAQKHFNKSGINRVILATDGDFNVGVNSRGALVRLIEQKRKSGVFLTVLGFGRGNVKDDTMEMLANKGNGNYAYIDSLAEARKVLVTQAGGTLVTIAKDVKIQVEFNPEQVTSYRLIGYENRLLDKSDFNNDSKDAGEIGAGHTVTALYEIIPKSASAATVPSVDSLVYQTPRKPSTAAENGELVTIKLRYKLPTANQSTMFSKVVRGAKTSLKLTSVDFRLAASVAAFGMLLRESKHKGAGTFAMAIKLAEGTLARDKHGYRRELVQLLKKAAHLFPQAKTLAR